MLTLTLTWIVFSAPATAADDASSDKPSYEQLLEAGDQAFLKRDDPEQAERAVRKYKKATQLRPHQLEAYLRLAMAYNWLGRVYENDRDKQVEAYQKGVDTAKKALEVAPDKPGPHYWLGVNLGELGQAEGVFDISGLKILTHASKGLDMAKTIQDQMETVIQMDTDYDSGGAHLVLGRVYQKLPGIAGGSTDKAEKHLKKAIEFGPKRYKAYTFLAELYMKQGQYDKAEKLLNQAIEGPCAEYEGPNCQVWKREARKVMAQLREKMS